MGKVLYREIVYFAYYFSIQFDQIAGYWAVGILIGSVVSVFLKDRIRAALAGLANRKPGAFGVIPASLLGIASPLCMYGTVPIAASLAAGGMREDWLAAFMMSSILLNPQLLAYSAALGLKMVVLRFVFCLLAGAAAGLCVRLFFRGRQFFSFGRFEARPSKDVHPNAFVRLAFSIGRNIRATGPYFLLGVALTVLYQRYVPQDRVAGLFGAGGRGFGVLLAATLGVPLYVCGGGTIPLLAEWLHHGMSAGSGVAFMLSGPATKFTNLSAVKIVFSARHFAFYLAFVILFSLVSGLAADLLF
jgi:uncharacterized membrane protein YraQ (UPF0718 family)